MSPLRTTIFTVRGQSPRFLSVVVEQGGGIHAHNSISTRISWNQDLKVYRFESLVKIIRK